VGRLVKLGFVLFNVVSCMVLFKFLMPPTHTEYPYILFTVFFSLLVYVFGGLDKQTSRSRNEMLFAYGISLFLSLLCLFALGGLLRLTISLTFACIIGLYYLFVVPIIVHMVYFKLFANVQKKNVIIVSSKEEYDEFVDQIMPKCIIPFNVIDHVTDQPITFQSFIDYNNKIDNVIVSNASEQIYQSTKKANVSAISLPLLYEKEEKRIPLNMIQQNEKYYLMSFEDNGVNHAIRLFDWVTSIILLFITLPLLIVSILLIRLIDGQDIFYKQERRGYRGKKFVIYKLSTMIPDPVINGNFITSRFGKILRILRINEIPQLFNVIMGDMSIVGPRPDIETTYEYCLKNIPYYHYRTNILPGITGHAQVHYKYVDKLEIETFSRRLSYDLYFVKNYSIYNYVIIIMKTIGSVLLMRGK
jgi:lipopolysaccharide/colanic/teichoic acid biosynthesis glycosyltransferase